MGDAGMGWIAAGGGQSPDGRFRARTHPRGARVTWTCTNGQTAWCWEAIREDRAPADTAVIAQVWRVCVFRSILSGINDTPLIESFSTYSLHFGCVIRLFETEGRWRHEVLWNQTPAEKEQHKPSGYYRK